jgi:CubicO group peptidase (beta-lactamase class C family)
MKISPEGRDERAARFLAGTIASSKFPGVQYVAVSAKERLFEYDGGLADVENAIPMSPATTMMAYSMTKTFTAVAVLQLMEQGKVSLDESALHYLPDIPYGPAVTVRHLLSQTSGLPNPIPLRWAHPVSRDPSFDEAAALREVMVSHPTLAFAPGIRYGYSNLSYWLCGAIIERIGGESYKSYMERHVIAPLGLTPADAGFSIVDASYHAKGYLARRSIMNLMKRVLLDKELIGRNEGRWLHILDHYLNGPAYGGLIGTARGISVFLQDQLKELSVLIKLRTRELFFARQEGADHKPVPMTLGWHIGDLERSRFFYKEGGGGGYHSEMRIYPERGVGSVIMVNETSLSCKRIQNCVDRMFLT